MFDSKNPISLQFHRSTIGKILLSFFSLFQIQIFLNLPKKSLKRGTNFLK